MSIWQELVERLGVSERYSAVGRFVRKLQGTRSPAARVVIATRPGEESQVDYGTTPQRCARCREEHGADPAHWAIVQNAAHKAERPFTV